MPTKRFPSFPNIVDVWGGQRLRPVRKTAEAWIIYEGDVIQTPRGRLTLGEAAGATRRSCWAASRWPAPAAFPAAGKLLDCADWLSVQVHPNDELAVKLEGPGQFGKTEAWHPGGPPQADPGRLKTGTTPAARPGHPGGGLLDVVQHLPVCSAIRSHPAGMLHARAPGAAVRDPAEPPTSPTACSTEPPGQRRRPRHIEQSLAVTDPTLTGRSSRPALADGARRTLIHCPYFTLEQVSSAGAAIALDTGGESFHALTVTQGRAAVSGDHWGLELGPHETVLVPAAAGSYRVEPQGAFQGLLAYVA